MKMIFNIIFIFSLFITINGQDNCTIYNKCGPYGYCYEDVNNQTKCNCKFWWKGELCNEQTNNGIQVIILGSLTAALVFLFYGLKIARSIFRKCKNPKDKKIKQMPQDSKLINHAMNYVKKSTQLSSCLVTILMIIVACGTLMAKWSIIQPIHNEIARKYKNKEPIYFQPNSFCNILALENFDVVTFPVALFLILVCVILTKRMSFMRNKCYGYGGPSIPLDFLSHIDRKFAAVVFAITADELYSIVDDITSSTDQSIGILVRFLKRLLQVLIMGVRFYPLLACVYINSAFTLACATLYAWLDYSFTILSQGMCNLDYYPTYEDYLANDDNNTRNIQDSLDYYGTNSNLIAVQLITDIPRYLCLAYISIKLPIMVVQKIYKKRQTNLPVEKKMLMSVSREEDILLRISHPNSIEMLYVQNLFRSPDQRPRSQSIWARLIPEFIYTWKDDFRFSSRILCIYSSVFLLLYFVVIKFSVYIIPKLYTHQSVLQGVVDSVIQITLLAISMFKNSDNTDDSSMNFNINNVNQGPVQFLLPNLVTSYIFAGTITVTIIVIQLIVLLVNIRRNLLQVYRGDDSEISRRQPSSYVSYAAGNFRFAGYFIGYMVWGFIMLAIFSTVVCVGLGTLIVNNGSWIIERALKAIIPGLLLALFKMYLNRMLAQYVFLQHFGDVLALNNRRIFMIFIYFNFFLDAFLGFISAVLRLVASFLGTIFYMSRLDYAPVGRKLEKFDSGYGSYSGFIHTECTHRHPVMLVFVSHLFNQIRQQQYANKHFDPDQPPSQEKYLMQNLKSLRHRRKWRLAAFLIRNPVILFYRKAFLKQLHLDDIRTLHNVDDNNPYNVRQAMARYVNQMATQRLTVLEKTDSIPLTTLRF